MKKLSRILLVACMLSVLVCLISTAALAADTDTYTYIDRVDLFCNPDPQVGDSFVEYYKSFRCAEQDAYSIQNYSSSFGQDIFQYGTKYEVDILCRAKTGYLFKDAKVYINGEDTGKVLNGDDVHFRKYIALGEPISQIVVPDWLDAQVGDSCAPVEVPTFEGANYTVTTKWTDYSLSFSAPTVLEDGKVYTLTYEIRPKEGYYFAEPAVVTVAGEPLDLSSDMFYIECSKDYLINVEYVDHVNISYTRPRKGEPLKDFTATTDGTSRLTELKVRPVTSSSNLEGKSNYQFECILYANTGYVFSENLTVTYNGGSPTVLKSTNLRRTNLVHVIDLALPVEQIAFPAWPESVEPGSAGGESEITVPESAGYTLKQVWMDVRTNQIVDTLTAGDVYTLAYMAEPKPGYTFTTETTATVGGERWNTYGDELLHMAYRSYDLGAQKLDRVDLTMPAMKKGFAFGEVKIPENANYTLSEMLWAESTTGKFEDALLVEAPSYGTTLYAIPVLCAGDGYIFGETVKFYLNGHELAVVDTYSEGPIFELSGLYGTLTTPNSGWSEEDYSWAFYKDGQRLTNSWLLDSKGWVYLDSEGLMVKNGWAQDSRGWCYMNASGYMTYKQWVYAEGGWYYLDAAGYRKTNCWMLDSVDWCYLGRYGRMLTDTWLKDSRGWCYLGSNGYMLRNAWVGDSAGICRLDANGYMVYDKWIHDGSGWAYVNSKGYVAFNTWVQDSRGWCYIGSGGYMVYDVWVRDGDHLYRIGSDGYMLVDQWVYDGYGWAFVNTKGQAVKEQWVRDSSGTCYIGSGYYMLKSSWINIDGKRYYVDENGHMLRNTKRKILEYYYYHEYRFDANGVATPVLP